MAPLVYKRFVRQETLSQTKKGINNKRPPTRTTVEQKKCLITSTLKTMTSVNSDTWFNIGFPRKIYWIECVVWSNAYLLFRSWNPTFAGDWERGCRGNGSACSWKPIRDSFFAIDSSAANQRPENPSPHGVHNKAWSSIIGHMNEHNWIKELVTRAKNEWWRTVKHFDFFGDRVRNSICSHVRSNFFTDIGIDELINGHRLAPPYSRKNRPSDGW